MAAVSWTTTGTRTTGACSAATMDAPTVVGDGLALFDGVQGLKALLVGYEATSGNLTVGGRLKAYLWIPQSATANKWHRAFDLDLTVGEAAGTAAWMGMTVPGGGYPSSRIAYVPSAIGQAGNVYIVGTK